MDIFRHNITKFCKNRKIRAKKVDRGKHRKQQRFIATKKKFTTVIAMLIP